MGRSSQNCKARSGVSNPLTTLDPKAVPRQPSGTPSQETATLSRTTRRTSSTPADDDCKSNIGSSTTLQSIVERLQPIQTIATYQIGCETERAQLRKTPFGVIRVPSGTSGICNDAKHVEIKSDDGRKTSSTHSSEGTLCAVEPVLRDGEMRRLKPWPCDTRGLPPVRQRIPGGRIELKQDGTIAAYHTEDKIALTIASDGQSASLLNMVDSDRLGRTTEHAPIHHLPLVGRLLYDTVTAWLSRYLSSVAVASFCTLVPSTVCNVRANAPLADYEVRVPINYETMLPKHGDIAVHVSRKRQTMKLSSFVGKGADVDRAERRTFHPAAWSLRVVRLSIVPTLGNAKRQHGEWDVDTTNDSSADVIVQQLSSTERHAIRHALSIATIVDAISMAIRANHERP